MDLEELRKLQKEEAVKRLKILQQMYNVHPNILNEFNKNDKIYYSERINRVFNGVLYWLDNKPEFVDAVKKIKDKYNIFVYHCILSHTEFGDWLDLLYVSDNLDNWENEKSKLMIGLPRVYTYDFSQYGSEFGDIEIAGINGGLTRLN